jgi:hypothetical protein
MSDLTQFIADCTVAYYPSAKGEFRVAIEIVAKRFVRRRSLEQNRLYWAILKCMSDETGNDSDDLHELMKARYLPKKWIKVKGHEFPTTTSTTDLNTEEFTEYIDKIMAFAFELNIAIPQPGDDGYNAFVAQYVR